MTGAGANAASGIVAPADRTGRIGVMYLRSLLAQAGIANQETSPGEDYGAIDVSVHLTSAVVPVQVKASGHKRRNKDDTYSITVSKRWCESWARQKVPVYLVLVVLSRQDNAKLVVHRDRSTTWHSHAYWLQVNDAKPGTVRVPVQNRVNAQTFAKWDADVRRAFAKGSP